MDLSFLVVFFSVLVVIVLITATTLYFLRTSKAAGTLRTEYERIRSIHSVLEARTQTVESNAQNYINSLNKKGVRDLTELRRTLNQVDSLLRDIEELLQSDEPHLIEEATQLLKGEHSSQKHSNSADCNSFGRRFVIPHSWDVRLEGLLQSVGRQVCDASENARKIGISSRNKKFPTLYSLFKAGIQPRDKTSASLD